MYLTSSHFVLALSDDRHNVAHAASPHALKYPITVMDTRVGFECRPYLSVARGPTVSPGASTQLPAAAVPTDVIHKLEIKINGSAVLAKTFFIVIFFIVLLLITKYYYPPYPTVNKQEYYSFTFNRALLFLPLTAPLTTFQRHQQEQVA